MITYRISFIRSPSIPTSNFTQHQRQKASRTTKLKVSLIICSIPRLSFPNWPDTFNLTNPLAVFTHRASISSNQVLVNSSARSNKCSIEQVLTQWTTIPIPTATATYNHMNTIPTRPWRILLSKTTSLRYIFLLPKKLK